MAGNYQFSMSKLKIVVVEDEPDILEVLTYNLTREGFDVTSAADGAAGLRLVQQTVPDLVLLDLMLPGMDGLDICRYLNSGSRTKHIPIIMVTAKGEESDVVLGLGIGADDYVTKPFSPRELIARVKAVLRRGNGPEREERIECGELLIDALKFRVSVNLTEIKLTATEFRLLHHLASHAGQVFSRQQLLDHALRDNAVVIDRNVDVHVRAIRRKLGDAQDFIETIRGIGYRFRDAD
jgi:DNA-binding response OmpR family regulator